MRPTLAPRRQDAGSPDPRISGAGIGLRSRHIDQVLRERPPVPWLELLADNHLASGGLTGAHVDAIRDRYPVALHCVEMNLGGIDPLDQDYLNRVRHLRDRVGAAWVSDHLCFTTVDGRHYHDLLPFPFTDEALRHVAARILRVQDHLGQRLLIENISTYLRFGESSLTEAEFLAALAAETDCLMLFDVNNLYINHVNQGEDVHQYLAAYPLDRVAEIHLAGYEPKDGYLLDAHNNPVSPPVWELFGRVCALLPPVPLLIEWDNDIPALEVLQRESRTAARLADDARMARLPTGGAVQ